MSILSLQIRIVLLACLTLVRFAYAQQNHTISGYVKEKGSQETLPGANVSIATKNTGTTTNNYGFYSITLPQDSVIITFSFTGYDPQTYRLFLDKNIQLDIQLANFELKEVVVSADKLEKISEEVQMSKIEIPIEQIKTIPALLGEKDVLKVIQLMPGVQKGSEGSSGIYVRGGGPDQNLIILDDATVYNVSHLFGFFSLFNGDALKNVELTKGGFPARYGGRLSSVLEMQMKDGNKEKIHGEAGIGLISSRLTLEGPIIKNKSSFLISARRTYIDAFIYPFLPTDQKAGYYFYDINAKVDYVLNYSNKLFLSGYLGNDRFYANIKNGDTETKSELYWGNATSTLRWNHLVNEKIFTNTSFTFTNFIFNIGITQKDQSDTYSLRYYSGIRDFSLKYDFDYSINPNHYLKAGILATHHTFTPGAIISKTPQLGDVSDIKQLFTTETGLYIEDDFKINNKLKLNAGVRLSNFNVRNESYVNPEPRLSARYKLNHSDAIKLSFATMNQYLHLLSNSGIGLPTDLWVPATNIAKPQRSNQVAIGYAKDLNIKNENYFFSVEAYYKKSTNVIGYKEGADFLQVSGNDPQHQQTQDAFSYEKIITSGNSESYGLEFFVQKKVGKFTGWVGYTLSWTWLQFDSINFGKRFPARYDRRHDISVVGTYELNERVTLSATWVFGTGNAISLPLSTYQLVDFSTSVNPSYLRQYEVTDYGEKNSFRMAPYHRFDIGIQWHKKRPKYERIFELSVYNVYNRHNPFFYYADQDKLKQISLFPILPSVSWTWKF